MHYPVTRCTHSLPLDRLSPADFERLCLGLVCREGYERVEHTGVLPGDGGCDLLAWRNGRRIAFQCKRWHRFGPADAQAAIEKLRRLPPEQRPDEFVLLLACDVSAETRERARAAAIPMDCWILGASELDERISRYPDLMMRFFGFPTASFEDLLQLVCLVLVILQWQGRSSKKNHFESRLWDIEKFAPLCS